LVRAPFFSAAERLLALRFLAADRAWRESDPREAARRPSRFNAPVEARERFAEGFFFLPALLSLAVGPLRAAAGLLRRTRLAFALVLVGALDRLSPASLRPAFRMRATTSPQRIVTGG